MRPNGRLAGKVAIVTGAGSTAGPGMATGRATAIAMAREGANMIVADIRRDRADQTADMIRSDGGIASVFEGDLTSSHDCEAMVAHAVLQFGAIDILVNNIGVSIQSDVVTATEEDWDRVFALNLHTMLLSSRHTIPVMEQQGYGSIVNIGSIAAVRGTGYVGYAAAKGAVHAATIDMAFSHGRNGVRVNTVAPGHITTPLLYSAHGPSAETDHRQRMAAASCLLGTSGTGWDVAWAAVFLASDEARWITGVALPVDGGVMSADPVTMAASMSKQI